MHSSLFVAAVALPSALAFPAMNRFPNYLSARADNDSCLEGLAQPSSTLSAPDASTDLVLIALGRGTQNYTCASESSTPSSIGAMADLYNVSCGVASAGGGPLGSTSEDANAVGQHFFVNTTTPEFDIIGLGDTQLKKVEAVAAPSASDVPWLKLVSIDDSTPVRNIYRLNTKGGVAPTTCVGQTAGSVVTVQYEAQYWIYASADAVEARRKKRSLGLPLN